MIYEPKKTAVVTGGSKGIGLATAKMLAEQGYDVYVFARTAPQEEVKGVKFVKCDMTDLFNFEITVRMWFAEVGRLDLLVNNAGMGISGAADGTPQDDVNAILTLNVLAFEKCCRMMIPYLRYTKGRLINVSSFAALTPIPFQAVYSASKAFVLNYSKAVALELKPFGVFVTAVLPGDVKTNFTSSRRKSLARSDDYGKVLAKSVEKMEKDEQNGMPPEKVAKEIVKIATMTEYDPPLTKIVGGKYKFFGFLNKIFPERWSSGIVYNTYCKFKPEKRTKPKRPRGFYR